MPEAVSFSAALVVAVTFAWAALAKSLSWEDWKSALAGYGLPTWVERAARSFVPVLELAVAFALVVAPLRVAAAAALACLAAFSLALLYARSKVGDVLPCGCFGKRKEMSFRVPLLRNILLGSLTALALAGPRSATVVRELSDADRTLPVLLVALGSVGIIWVLRNTFASMKGERR